MWRYAGRSTRSEQRVEAEKKTIWQLLDIDVKCALQMLDASDHSPKHAIATSHGRSRSRGVNPNHFVLYTTACSDSAVAGTLLGKLRLLGACALPEGVPLNLGQARCHVDFCTCQTQPSADKSSHVPQPPNCTCRLHPLHMSDEPCMQSRRTNLICILFACFTAIVVPLAVMPGRSAIRRLILIKIHVDMQRACTNT